MSNDPDLLRRGLKISHLKLMQALGRTGQVSAAAAALNISQPAASRLASEAESIIGAPLYLRTGRGIALTHVGAALAARAGRVIREMDDASREIAEMARGAAGRVSIGAVTGPAIEHVLPAIRHARLSLPNVSIEIEVGPSDTLGAMLLEGRLDFALARLLPGQDGALFDIVPIGPEPVSLVVRRGHPLLREASLPAEWLLDYDWVMPASGAILTTMVQRALEARGLPLPSRRLNTASFLLTLATIGQTNAIAPVASAVANAFSGQSGAQAGIAELRTDLALEVEPYALMRRADHRLTPAAQQVYALLAQKVGLGPLAG